MNKTVRVGYTYLAWAHGPLALEGHEPSLKVMGKAKYTKGMIEMDLTDKELKTELVRIARKCAVPGCVERHTALHILKAAT
tara:strand:+ start:1442 stop:1684 length:243 start_codon:yes stop_codon:yes gene_type:complete